VLHVLFRRRLRLITITGATTDIVTTAIITDIIISAATTGTAFGLPVPVGIIAIGERCRLRRVRSIEGWRRQTQGTRRSEKEIVDQVTPRILEKLRQERFPNAVLAREGMEISIGEAT
jgi:hypothetical protein